MTFAVPHLIGEGGAPKLANLVTVSRLVLVGPILALLLAGRSGAALALYLLAAGTDGMDGWLARREGRMSEYGAKLDAVVDNLFSIAILPFLLFAVPGVGERHPLALLVLFAGPVLYLAVSLLLTGRPMMFHFVSAKLGALLLFALWPVLAWTGWEWVVPLAALAVGLSRLEQVWFMLRGGTDLDAPHGFAPVIPPD